MTDKTVIEPPPDTIKYAYWALLVAAVGAVVSPLVLLTQRAWLEHSTRTSDAKAKPPVVRTGAQVHKLASDTMTLHLITGVVLAALLVLIAINIRKGNPRARMGLYGVYVLLAVTGLSLVGVFSIFNVASSVPGVLKVVTFIGAVSLLAGVVLTTMPASRAYFSRNRPVRAPLESRAGAGAGAADRAGGPRQSLLGSLFAPRPGAARANLTKPSLIKPNQTAATKPATTRPGGSTAPAPSSGQPMRRGKAKARATVEGGPGGSTVKKSKAKGR
jgi:hypothetical protein